MAGVRFWCCLAIASTALCSEAGAAEVTVLQRGGGTVVRHDPGVAGRDRTPVTHLRERPRAGGPAGASASPGRRSRAATAVAARRRGAARRTVAGELARLRDSGALDLAAYDQRLASYRSFRAAVRRFSGRRRIEMAGVLATVEGIAARGALTASRLPALWLTLERNRRWWNEGPLLAPGARVSFDDSELVWQYVPGQGLQLHPLANFGKLNALWRSRLEAGRMAALLDELMALPAERAGGIAWEYYFAFGGGRPPWVSSLAQGTGLQALSRAAIRSGRGAELLPRLRAGLGVFRMPPPSGVRIAADGGAHYLQYSFAPRLQVFNGFVQSLVGLHDFAAGAADAEAQGLYEQGLAAARAEVPASDTGAWSLYSRGSVTRESDLHYHGVLRDFLESLCVRAPEPVFCDTVQRFDAYLSQPPALRLVTRRLRGGRSGVLRFELSKIARVTVAVRRGTRTALWRRAVLGRGVRELSLAVPRRAGAYEVSISATDLAGNPASLSGTVEVLRPRRR